MIKKLPTFEAYEEHKNVLMQQNFQGSVPKAALVMATVHANDGEMREADLYETAARFRQYLVVWQIINQGLAEFAGTCDGDITYTLTKKGEATGKTLEQIVREWELS